MTIELLFPTTKTKRYYPIYTPPSNDLKAKNSTTARSRFPTRSSAPTTFSKVAQISLLPPHRPKASDLPKQLALLHLLNIYHPSPPLPWQPFLRRFPARPLSLPRAPTPPRALRPPPRSFPSSDRRIPPGSISPRYRDPLHQQQGRRLPPTSPPQSSQCPAPPRLLRPHAESSRIHASRDGPPPPPSCRVVARGTAG